MGFQRAYTPTTRTPTRYIPPTTTSSPAPTTTIPAPAKNATKKKVIIGAAVGGVLGGLILITAIGIGLCLLLRRLKKKASEDQSARPPSELPSQSMSNVDQPPGSTLQGSPTVSRFTFTPQGSPPPASDRAWSYYGRMSPESPTYPATLGKETQGNYSLDPGYNRSMQASPVACYAQTSSSPVEAAQEMPIVRSPLGLHAQQQPQSLNIGSMDPYFVQNPPRGAPSSPGPT